MRLVALNRELMDHGVVDISWEGGVGETRCRPCGLGKYNRFVDKTRSCSCEEECIQAVFNR